MTVTTICKLLYMHKSIELMIHTYECWTDFQNPVYILQFQLKIGCLLYSVISLQSIAIRVM